MEEKKEKITKRRTKEKSIKKGHFVHETKGLIIFLITIIALLDLWGYDVGVVGQFIGGFFSYGFGIGSFVICAILLYVGWTYLYHGRSIIINKKRVVMSVFILLLLTLVTLIRVPLGQEFSTSQLSHQGGLIGAILAAGLRAIVGNTGSILSVIILSVICVIFITGKSLSVGMHRAKEKAEPVVVSAKDKAEEKLSLARAQLLEWREDAQERRRQIYNQEKDPRYPVDIKRVIDSTEEVTIQNEEVEITPFYEFVEDVEPKNDESNLHHEDQTFDSEHINEASIEEACEEEILEEAGSGANNDAGEIVLEDDIPTFEGTEVDTAAVSVSLDNNEPKVIRIEKPYCYPSLELLSRGPRQDGVGSEVSENAKILEETLKSFGVSARIINATQGPAVTRYELEPAAGVKVNKIVNLADDIALKLAATDIRMEAPIPGKAAIGIEVPNKSISSVHLRDVLECDEFLKAKGGIPVGLGKDIAGKPIITDLAKMPHLLVAGSTGSGKSVCINTLISSILFSRKPEEVKLILIDPKMVELSNYNGVPHLMTPVVTDTKKASFVLRWAVKEMESRYRAFAASNVRDIKRYNELFPDKAMPLVVIIIDELADLMMVSPVDVEDAICRLAQMARAAGLHLVLATQRPSVDVITGTIKANVPSRISFAVSSQIDSRTILDMAGAEKLLGKGDMLFNPIGANKPIRIQGAFVSDEEVERVVSFMKKQGEPEYNEQVLEVQTESEEALGEDLVSDELLEKAIELVMESGQASVSMLQRRFRIGYTRAARLVDTMEDMKIVGPNVGSKARDILMTSAEVKEKYFSN